MKISKLSLEKKKFMKNTNMFREKTVYEKYKYVSREKF